MAHLHEVERRPVRARLLWRLADASPIFYCASCSAPILYCASCSARPSVPAGMPTPRKASASRSKASAAEAARKSALKKLDIVSSDKLAAKPASKVARPTPRVSAGRQKAASAHSDASDAAEANTASDFENGLLDEEGSESEAGSATGDDPVALGRASRALTSWNRHIAAVSK